MPAPVTVTNKRFDARGCEVGRVLKHRILYQLLPLGNFGGGPGFFILTRLWLIHHFGRLLVRLAVFLKRRL